MMEKLGIEAMRRHVEDLVASLSCADDYIEVRWIDRPMRAKASRDGGEIIVPHIRSAISYATALHEVGHFLGRHQQSRNDLVRERWAWDWARRNALVWTPIMEQSAQPSLAWYAARNSADGG